MNYPELPRTLAQALDGAALVPAPEVLLRLMRAVEDEGCSLEQLAAIVDKDPAITARILGAANSSAFHRGRSLSSIEECLQVLGLRVVRSIAVCLSVQCVFTRQADNANIDLAPFWYHSLLAAELGRALATASDYPAPGEAYLGGLLHDIGELALLSALRDEYATLLALATDESRLSELEFSRLGATHAEVGAWLVDQWRLDSSLADSVLFHHASPAQISEADLLARIVWCAHQLGSATADNEPALIEQVVALLPVSAESIADQLGQARSRVVLLAEAMGIHLKEPLSSSLPEARFATPLSASDPTSGMLESMAETAILQSLQKNAGTSVRDGDMLYALSESLRILFGVSQSAFMRYDPVSESLIGLTGQHAVIVGMRLPLATTGSLAARALCERRMLGSQDESEARPTTLADIQVCRALQSESLLCVPLMRGQQPLGVLLLGSSAAQQIRLRARPTWLQSFARITVATLESIAAETHIDSHPAVAAIGREQQIRRFSHEVGNPLSIIKSYLRLLENKMPADSGVRDELLVLKEEIERVVRIVRQLSESPVINVVSDQVDLNAVVTDLLKLYGESMFTSRGIEIDISLDVRPPQVHGDQDAIKQVLLNLLKNASEALTAGERVSVDTSSAMLHEGVQYAGFVVQDNGPGIPMQIVQRLFAPLPEPAVPGSRGMGLSIVGGLIRHMRGRVVCETRQGSGTRISVLLPLAAVSKAEGSR